MNVIGSIDGLVMGAIGPDSMVNADCLEAMKLIPDKSIDCIICDLPYGVTALKWDVVIPFDLLWEQYKRIIKPNGAIALFGSQPFTSALVMSNPKWFKYEWIWEKNIGSNFASTKYQPFKEHENILIFGKGRVEYHPIPQTRTQTGLSRAKYIDNQSPKGREIFGGLKDSSHRDPRTLKRCPRSIQKFNVERGAHPTQKSVQLIEYLVKTYTIEGELILDNTSGSGTTAIACLNTSRRYICIEKDPHYFQVSCDRVATHNPNAPIVKPKKTKAVPKGQLALF